MNFGHFPAGDRVRESLARSRIAGLSFTQAWNVAMGEAHLRRNGHPLTERQMEDAEAIKFARKAFRRAYEGHPPTAQDHAARGLLEALEFLYDQSVYADPTAIEQLMEAA